MRYQTQFKKRRYLLMLLLFMAVTFNSCVKPFTPGTETNEESLVVDGNINDGPGPYTITLSKSSLLKKRSDFNPFTKCTVEVEDNVGTIITFNENEPGVYRTGSWEQGITGRFYKLKITTPEGELYESKPEVLVNGLKIQSLYGELQHKEDPKYFFGRDGYQFYVDAETAPVDNYILWRMESTYKFNVDYRLHSYYDQGLHPVYHPDSLKTCYRTQSILQLYLFNTNAVQKIKRFPLNYEDNYSKALSIRYSLKVAQFTISKEAFTYWNSIKKMAESGGELFTQQPFQVANNLINTTHPDKPVFGYFMVAGLSEERIFISPHPSLDMRLKKCPIRDPQFDPVGDFRNNPELWPVFFTSTFEGLTPQPLYVDQECVDCRKTGVLEKPDFWVE